MAEPYAHLDPDLVPRVRLLEVLAAEEGIPLRITQGYRSPEEQERLYAQGRTTPGKIVTYAKPGASRHQHGAAVDVVPLTDGKPDWNSPYWDRVGQLGESVGLRWGGRFTRLTDRPHFELAAAGSPTRPERQRGQDERGLITRMIHLEALEQGVDPALALAVATQESSLDPRKVGDHGKSLGLFQLQEAAAIDAGIDPRRRGETVENIRGGIAYLKQGLDRFGGNPRQVLERHYNRGGDPDYYAHVMQYYPGGEPQTTRPRPGLLARVGHALSPASAEAATMPSPTERQGMEQRLQSIETMEQRLQAIEALEAREQAPQAPPSSPWWQQAARSAVRTASGGILGGLPELAVPAVQRMTDPTQAPQTAADVGELVGQQVGSAILPGPGTAVGGTLGAVTGLTAGTLATEGRLPTGKEVGREAVWSVVPEVLESGVRSVVRTVARGTQGGRLIRLDEAARRARELPQVFNAQTREAVGQEFEAVRQSGVQLDIGPLRQEIQGLRQGKYEDLLSEVQRLDRQHKTGQRYQQLMENLRQGGTVRIAGWPIGDLQQLRSGLRQRIDELDSTEARDLLRNAQRAVDDAIDQGLARGRVAAGQTPEQLREARRQWSRVRAHEDLQTLVERSVKMSPDLTMSSFNLRQLADTLRRNEGQLARDINHSLDHTPGARAAFQRQVEEIAGLFQTVELPMADVFGIWRAPGFAMVRQGISTVLTTQAGRQVFRDAIVEGRGRLSLNGFAAAVNAGRRELGLEPLEIPGLEEEKPGTATAPTTPRPGG